MATLSNPKPRWIVEEYLAASWSRDAKFVDKRNEKWNLGEKDYSILQRTFAAVCQLAAVAALTLSPAWIGCRGGANVPLVRPRLAAGATMQEVTFTSVALGRQMPYRVFLPERIAAGAKLPVVYLLHGKGGTFRDWSTYSDVARYASQGLILVMPEGNSSYYVNAVEKHEDKYEDYIVHDLIGDVQSRFPARMDGAGRAIVGVSMGGFGALTLAFRHPELFVFAGALSPPVDAPERRLSWKRWSQWMEFRAIFGPWGSAERDARDPFVLARLAKARTVPALYLTEGEAEPLREPIERFAARVKWQGLACEFHSKPGGHDWGEWDQQLPALFERLMVTLGR